MSAYEIKRAKFEAKFDAAKDLAEYPVRPNTVSDDYVFQKASGDRYTCKVVKSKTGVDRVECDCKGYTFNSYCKHSTHVRLLRGDVLPPVAPVLPLLSNA